MEEDLGRREDQATELRAQPQRAEVADNEVEECSFVDSNVANRLVVQQGI